MKYILRIWKSIFGGSSAPKKETPKEDWFPYNKEIIAEPEKKEIPVEIKEAAPITNKTEDVVPFKKHKRKKSKNSDKKGLSKDAAPKKKIPVKEKEFKVVDTLKKFPKKKSK